MEVPNLEQRSVMIWTLQTTIKNSTLAALDHIGCSAGNVTFVEHSVKFTIFVRTGLITFFGFSHGGHLPMIILHIYPKMFQTFIKVLAKEHLPPGTQQI